MKIQPVSLASALVLLSVPAAAQQSKALYDAPVVVFPDTTGVCTLADLDGDGDRDAVGWWFEDTNHADVIVSGFLSQGDGTFQPAFSLKRSAAGSEYLTWTMDAGRFDANDREDLVCTFHDEVHVFRSSPGGAPAAYAAWVEPSVVRSAAVLDFDEDGLDDLALSVLGHGVRLYRNLGTGFAAPTTLPANGTLRTLDVDGDPALELAALDGGTLVLLDPASGSPLVQSFSLPYSAVDVPLLAAGDVDGDGDEDVVVFSEKNETYVLVRRTGPSAFVAEPATAGGPATDLADVDGDGDLDGVCCGSGGPSPERNTMPSTYRVARNDGAGGFQVAEAIEGMGAFRLAGADDVDQDGDLDLVAGRVILYGRDSFAQETQPHVGLLDDDWLLIAADRDGDGDPDLSRGFKVVHANDGTGRVEPTALVLPDPPDGTIWKSPGYVGDFDGDGDVDAIAGVAWGSTFHGLRLLLNTSGGGFVDGGWAAAPGTAFGNSTNGFDAADTSYVAGDFDEDGDLDLAVGSEFGVIVCKIWRNQGDGTFLFGSQFLAQHPVECADLDGDGHLDLVLSRDGLSLQVAFGAGDGTFGGSVTLATHFYHDRDRLAVADLDEDGLLDVAAIDHSTGGGPVHLWMQQGGRAFTKSEIAVDVGKVTTLPCRVLADDVDGDGHVDLVFTSPDVGSGVARVRRGDGTGAFPTEVLQVLDPRALVDVDGDGDLDVAGDSISRNLRHHFPEDGRRRQFGQKTPGFGGMSPTLGATGPFRAGGEISLRLVGGRGASVAVLMVGGAPALQPGWPAPGLEGYVSAPVWVGLLPLGGYAPNPGSGAALLPPAPVPASAAGAVVTLQAFVFDPDAESWLTQTNGLELRID